MGTMSGVVPLSSARVRRYVFLALLASSAITGLYSLLSYSVLPDRTSGFRNVEVRRVHVVVACRLGRLGHQPSQVLRGDSTITSGRRGRPHVQQQQGYADSDESVRCRTVGICDTKPTCTEDDSLACVTETAERQERIKQAALFSWHAYQGACWGQDEFLPVSNTCEKWFNLGLTMVDGLDTMMLMGAEAEVLAARQWVVHNMTCAQDHDNTNLFETTIRILGGLLSAFHLSGGDALYQLRALELGLRLLPAFNSSSGIPYSDINLKTHHASAPVWTSYSSLSEVSTLDMEFSYLAHITGRPELEAPALNVMRQLANMAGKDGALAPMYVDPKRGRFHGHHISFGARSDSYYEYLLKAWLLTGKKHAWLLSLYTDTMRDARAKLLQRSASSGLLFLAEMEGDAMIPKMDHLVCFMPGAAGEPTDLELAESMAETCYEMYRQTPIGLAPEIVFFNMAGVDAGYPKQHTDDVGNGDFIVKPADSHNLLRPETVESLFVLWRVTGNPRYREWGWNIFRAFERSSRVETGGYTSLDSVLHTVPLVRDKQESFWMAETLKYLFLLFDDSGLVPLKEFVFNTEAHPLPMLGSAADKRLLRHHLHAGGWGWLAANQSVEALEADLARVQAMAERAVSKNHGH